MQPALTSHYEVFIQAPKDVDNFIQQSFADSKSSFSSLNERTNLLMLSCSDASLPGSTLATHDLNNDFTGVTQRHAYRRLYDDRADFTFYVNHNYEQIAYFESWMRYIIGEQASDANNHNLTGASSKSYRVKYPQKYKTTIYITKFERNIGVVGEKGNTKSNPYKADPFKGSKKMIYSFFNSFPISVSSMPISYETSQLLKITVSFSYDRYIAGNSSISSNTSSQPGQSTANIVPKNPFDLDSPLSQAQINALYSQNLNLGNYSPGTFTNTNLFTQGTITNTNFFTQPLF